MTSNECHMTHGCFTRNTIIAQERLIKNPLPGQYDIQNTQSHDFETDDEELTYPVMFVIVYGSI